MTEERHTGQQGQQPDTELNIKAILATGFFLLAATLAGMAISWWLSVALKDRIEAADPPPPTLLEAQRAYEPPGPQLQTDPATELAQARAEEDAILDSWEWLNADHTEARVPIERAMELLLSDRPGAEAFNAGATEVDGE